MQHPLEIHVPYHFCALMHLGVANGLLRQQLVELKH